jgi:hypothetical protein
MTVAAGRSFFDYVHTKAEEIVPDRRWILITADSSWSESPEDCDLVVLAGDAYTSAFVNAVLKLPAVRYRPLNSGGRFSIKA